MLKFVVCDDNVDVMNKLANMLEAIFTQNDIEGEVVYKTTKGEEILEYTKNNLIDVLVLDINLNSEKNGIDIANKVREKNKGLICLILINIRFSNF